MQIQNIYYGINSQKKNSVKEIAVKNNFTNHYSTKQLTASDSLDLCNGKNSSSQVCFNGLLDFFKKKNTKMTRQEAREKLLSYKTPDGKNIIFYENFSTIINYYRKNSRLIDDLIELKNPDGTLRFGTQYSIDFDLISAYVDRPGAVMTLANMRKTDGTPRIEGLGGIPIYKLAEACEKYPKDLSAILEIQNPDGTYRFIDKDDSHNERENTALLAEDRHKYLKEFEELIKYKNPDDTPRFDAYEIHCLVSKLGKYRKEIDYILSIKNPDGTYRFDGRDCSNLVEVYHDDPDTVNYFMNMKKADGTPLLTSGYEISEYAKKYKECPTAVQSFFNDVKPDGSLSHSILDFDIYTSNHLKYPAEQEELLNIRVRDDKQISLFDINILAEAYKKYPEEVIYLLNLKNPEGTITLADEGKMRSYIEAGYLYEVGSMVFGNPWRELNVETISQLAKPLHNNPEKVKQILNSTYEYTIGEKYDYDTVSRLERGYHKNLKVNFNYIMAPYKDIKVLLSDADILEKVNSL